MEDNMIPKLVEYANKKINSINFTLNIKKYFMWQMYNLLLLLERDNNSVERRGMRVRRHVSFAVDRPVRGGFLQTTRVNYPSAMSVAPIIGIYSSNPSWHFYHRVYSSITVIYKKIYIYIVMYVIIKYPLSYFDNNALTLYLMSHLQYSSIRIYYNRAIFLNLEFFARPN